MVPCNVPLNVPLLPVAGHVFGTTTWRPHGLPDSLHGPAQEPVIYLVDVHGPTNSLKHGKSQPASQVLAELFQAGQQLGNISQLRVVQREPETPETPQHPVRVGAGQAERHGSVDCIDRNADRHGFAVPQREIGHGFQLVSRPVAEVERTSFEHFEGVAAAGDMLQVQFRGPLHDGQTDGYLAAANLGRRSA
jgi:hypothetical protein